MCNVRAIQNAAFAKVYGVDFDLNVYFMSYFNFSVNLNWQHGTEELDNGKSSPLRHSPPFYGHFSLLYQRDNYKLNLYSYHSSSIKYENMPIVEIDKPEIYAIDNNGKPYCPDWWTLNFKADYKLWNHIGFGFGIENILDKRYRPYSSGIVAAGRNFIFSIKYFN